MLKKILAAAAFAVLAACPAFAGDHAGHDHAKADAKPDMAAMEAEMMNCAICKNLVPHMAVLGPVMKSEVVTLDNGMAIVHVITDPKLIPTFHEATAGMNKAGAACAAMPDAQRKAALCAHCEQMMSLSKAGATLSFGDTKDGAILVLASEDPAQQTKISAMRVECTKMMSGM